MFLLDIQSYSFWQLLMQIFTKAAIRIIPETMAIMLTFLMKATSFVVFYKYVLLDKVQAYCTQTRRSV